MEQSPLKASIIIRAYNAEATIVRAISSACSQDFDGAYEVVVIDDGSTDNTTSIVERLSDTRVRIIKQENKGAAAAANSGFRSAVGEIAVLLDADDEALPIMLSAAMPLLEDPTLAYTYPDYYEEYKGSRNLIQIDNPFSAIAGGMGWRKAKLLAEGGFAEDTIFPEYELLLRTWDRWQGMHVPEAVMIYHRREESLAGNDKLVRESIEALRLKYPNLVSEIEKIRSYEL